MNFGFLQNCGAFVVFSICLAFFFAGCGQFESDPSKEYLIRVEESVVTVDDFKRALEIAKTAYEYNAIAGNGESETGEDTAMKKARFRMVKIRVLSEMTERLVLHQRAKELGIRVAEAELEKEISKVKSSFPEGEFEKTLLESAITFPLWKEQLKDRMLMEKVIAADIRDKIEITPEELAVYYKNNFKNDSSKDREKADEMMIRRLRRKKVEETYGSWLENLKKKYKIEINREQWENISES